MTSATLAPLSASITTAESPSRSKSEPASSWATKFARTGAGRDWLHAFARQRVGRVLLTGQAIIYLAAVVLVFTGIGGIESDARRGIALTVAALLHTITCALVWQYGLLEPATSDCGAKVGDHPLWQRVTVAAAILASMTVIAVDFSVIWSGTPATEPSVIEQVLAVAAVQFTAAAFSSMVSNRFLAIIPISLTGVVAVAQLVTGLGAHPEMWGATLILAYLLVLKIKLSNWHETLWAEWEADLDLLAALAATEERLAIARDLHDTTGQSLAVIAVKAELAQMHFERGDAAAIKEAREVNRLAREALAESRHLSMGLRRTDLRAELAGAKVLAESMGVQLQVAGDADAIATPVSNVFGWVLREATTNISRHAKPTRIDVLLDVIDGQARISIVNDGSTPPDVSDEQPVVRRRAGGSGLPGLRERLAAIGGILSTGYELDTFHLTATAPNREAAQ